LRIDEECIVIDSRNAIEVGVERFVKWLFSTAYATAVYIATEPMVVMTRVSGKLRGFAIGPGSAILCYNKQTVDELFSTVYRVAEPCWGDAMLLIPYTSTTSRCSKARQMGFEMDLDEAIGIPHICVTNGEWSELKLIIDGGMAEIEKYSKEVAGALQITTKNTLFFSLAKGLLANLRYENIIAKVMNIRFDYKSKVYLEDLTMVNEDVIIYKFGKGLITTFTDLNKAMNFIYPITLLVAHLLDVNSAKAIVYRTKLAKK
jgi:hypothetical protein